MGHVPGEGEIVLLTASEVSLRSASCEADFLAPHSHWSRNFSIKPLGPFKFNNIRLVIRILKKIQEKPTAVSPWTKSFDCIRILATKEQLVIAADDFLISSGIVCSQFAET
ncbi:hypothetical protein HNY73_012806 [Argiope bruennichi]|uniref:Uncharacterized protein n=1 Tax=Argiope bruennichi TaxID=94029 RepID=A0A8T0EY78_ARGBR|nr:hypothetical protein HNY73_012806 [Argiope bruennichi]